MESWRAEAQRLYAEGKTPSEISAIVGKPRSTVTLCVDHRGYKARAAARNEKRRKGELTGVHSRRRAPDGTVLRQVDGEFVRDCRRKPKTILDPRVRDEAVHLFAKGAIDRAELCRRLREGAPA